MKAVLPNYSVHLTQKESKPHQGSSTVVEVTQEAAEVGKSPDSDAKLCTYILDIVSGNGRVATIDRPFGYNNDIQPFLPCSVLPGGVAERKHDRKTQTAAVTWAFRSMVARQLRN